jgi:hypothetical protein
VLTETQSDYGIIAADKNGMKCCVALENADMKAGTVDSLCVTLQNVDMKAGMTAG